MMKREFDQNILKSKPKWLRNAGRLVVAVIVIGVLAAGAFFVFGDSNTSSSENKPTVDIQRTYEVVARTKEKKRTTGRFELSIINAQFADSILVQGQKARPIKGKVFLIINMEIKNPHKVELYAFPVDLFRFVRSDGQKFAPSVHQGTVLVRPEATKKSNIAFVVFPTEKNFKLEVGEVGDKKETLEINF